jgi:polyisoprenoid-binding protein YceI
VTRYRIDPERSTLSVQARSSIHPIHVETTGLEGHIDADLRDGCLSLAMPPAATIEIDVRRLQTGNGLYDRELERRLDRHQYPRIRGTVRQVTPGATGDRYHVRGELSLHGITRPVEGDVTIRVRDSDTIEIEGEHVLDMRDFGLEPPRLLMLRVHPDVRIHGRVVATRTS